MVPNAMSSFLGMMLLLMKASLADVLVWPENAVSMEGSPVTLRCRVSADDSCQWLAAASLGAVPLTVYNGDNTKLDNKYYVNTSLSGQCDLTILTPRLTSPLVYACADNHFGEPRYASLTVLKSNLLCAHNVKCGSKRVTVRYSMNVVYASEMSLSVYLERSNGSVEKVCDDTKKDGNRWRLECDYAVDMNESRAARFFVAVSEVIRVRGIKMDKTVPTERFYCSNDDWLTVDRSSDNSVSDSETMNVSSVISAVATEDAVSGGASTTCSPTATPTPSPLVIISFSLLAVVLSVVMIVLCLCCCRRTQCSCRKIQQQHGGHEGENDKFVRVD